jgi:proton glutamate symport protein
MKTPSLAVLVLIGGVLGILAGIFFGEYCRVLSPFGSVYIMLLQSVVFPYILCSLIHGLGSLEPATAVRLFKRGGIFYFFAWTVTLISAWILTQAIPPPGAPALINGAAHEDSASKLLTMFLPANVFVALTHNYIPAVVVFSVLFGIALQAFPRKTSILDTLDAIRAASTKIWGWVVKLAPVAVFALFAELSGTISFARVERLIVYLLLFIGGTLLAAFWMLPAIMGALTPYSPRRILAEIKDGLILAAITSLPVSAVPAIAEAVQKLAAEDGVDDPNRDEVVKTTLSVSYPLGQLGNLYAYLFILFAISLYKTSVTWLDHLLLPLFTLFSTFGTPVSTVDAVQFIGSWLQLPSSSTSLYVEAMTLTRYPQVIASAVGLTFLTMLITFSFFGKLRVQPKRLLLALVLPALAFALIAFGAFRLELLLNPRATLPYDSFTLHPSITEGVDATVYRVASRVPESDRDAGVHETTLERIQRTGTLRVGYHEAVIPFSYFNDQKQLVGFDIAVAYELARSLNVKLVFIPFEWNALNDDLEANRFDIAMSGIYVTADRIRTVSASVPYFRSNLALIVPSEKATEFLSRAQIDAKKDLRIVTFQSRVLGSLVHKFLPSAKISTVPDYNDLARVKSFDAALWTEEQAVALARTSDDLTAVLPADFGGPILFAYLMPPNSPDLLRYVNYWLTLEDTQNSTERLTDYWLEGLPWSGETPRWSVIRNVLHWVD